MEHEWYVLQVFSNYEHKIQRTLTDRIEITGLQSEITDVVVPIEEVVELKGLLALQLLQLEQPHL